MSAHAQEEETVGPCGLLQQGQTFAFTFSTPGTFAYYCAVHPAMGGTVVVTP